MAESSGPQSPSPPQAPANPAPQHSWPRTALWVGVVVVLALTSVYGFRSCLRVPGEVLGKAGKAFVDVVSAFKAGTITTSFVSYATTVSNQHYLQFATLKQMEIFTREQPTTVFGYPVLPDVVVEARAPVEYTYYLDLNDRWRFDVRDNTLYVFAPAIKFNKPAVDASAISYEVRKGYVKTTDAQENLKKSITGLSVLRAKENIPLVRENARRQTSEFVEKWLMRSFTDGKQYPVRVYFPDESPPGEVKVPYGRSN